MAGSNPLYADIMTLTSILLRLKTNERRIWLMAMAVFVIGFSLYTMLCFIVGSDFLGINGRAAAAMFNGTALRPHVYRQMVPMIAHGVIAISPEALQEAVAHGLQSLLTQPNSLFASMVHFRHPFSPPKELTEHLYLFAVVCVADYLFLLAYVYYVWALARRLVPGFFSVQIIAPCLAIVAIAPFCAKFAYIYDFPVLFFSAWLTAVLLEKRLVLFTCGIAIATFNKETSLYLIALFAMYGYKELPRREWATHLLCQCVLFVAIKTGVTLYYQGNAGEFLWTRGLYDHVLTNLDGYSVYTFLGLVAAVAVLGYGWGGLPFILQCWMVMLPFSVLSWLVFGMRNEYRVMYEMFPALLVISSRSLGCLLQRNE